MLHLTIDFETRSQADLKNGGSYRYAADPTTRAMCLAILINRDGKKEARIHIPNWVLAMHPTLATTFVNCSIRLEDVIKLIEEADTIEAHNAEFERNVWDLCFCPLYPLPLKKLHCSAAKAAMHDLPRALGFACQAIKAPQQKDTAGASVMMRMCKPRKALKADKEKYPDWETRVFWHESREEFEILIRYCLQDVWSEDSFSEILRDLPAHEREVWILDQTINRRGVAISVPDVENLLELVRQNEKQLLEEFGKITNGECSPRQVAKLTEIIAQRGAYLPDLRKETVLEYLAQHEDDIDPVAERLLEIRLGAAKSSTAKFSALLKMVTQDSRVHGLLLYHGAGTGRWAGQKVQPQNLPSRGILKYKHTCEALKTLETGVDSELIDLLYGPPLWVASSALRLCFVAPKGKDLIAADYKAIEGRVLAWLAGEQYVVDAYRRGFDTYILAAAGIYHCSIDEVDSTKRQIGKVAELACGYQGGIGAFHNMARGYGLKLPDDDARRIVAEWRESHPETKKYWSEVENAAKNAIKNPGQTVRYRNIAFKRGNVAKLGNRDFLCCRLPSGRMLHYPYPELGKKMVSFNGKEPQEREEIRFWGVDPKTKRWTRQATYGGKLVENITQAVSRDLLADAMLRIEDTGKYEVVLHVHDEAIAEVEEGKGDLEEYCAIMSELPEWAAGLPVAAEGWIGKRYKK